MFRYLFPSGLAEIQQLWVNKELGNRDWLCPVLPESRTQAYTCTITLQALPSPLELLLCTKVFAKSIKDFPPNFKTSRTLSLSWWLLSTTPQTFSDFVLIWLFLFSKGGRAETPSKREKVMLNFPFGSRQENTMGVLCPGGMQGIPEDGHRLPELSVFYNRRLESSERVHYVHLVQAG